MFLLNGEKRFEKKAMRRRRSGKVPVLMLGAQII
jgi:hypothetical protein